MTDTKKARSASPQLIEAATEFANKLLASQKDLPPEAAQVLHDNFWNLLSGAGGSEAERAGMNDVVSAGSPSDLATIESLQLDLATLRSTHATLQRALRNLTAEVRGVLGLIEVEMRHAAGNTNVSCLQRRLDEGLEALNGAPGTE